MGQQKSHVKTKAPICLNGSSLRSAISAASLDLHCYGTAHLERLTQTRKGAWDQVLANVSQGSFAFRAWSRWCRLQHRMEPTLRSNIACLQLAKLAERGCCKLRIVHGSWFLQESPTETLTLVLIRYSPASSFKRLKNFIRGRWKCLLSRESLYYQSAMLSTSQFVES